MNLEDVSVGRSFLFYGISETAGNLYSALEISNSETRL